MSDDEVIALALERGWTTAAHVDAARLLEADLRARGSSPGLLAVLAQALQPEHRDALRREHAAASAALITPTDAAVSVRLAMSTPDAVARLATSTPDAAARLATSSADGAVSARLAASSPGDAATPVFESGRLPRSDQPTARYDETLPLPPTAGGLAGAPILSAARPAGDVGTARYDETIPLPSPPPADASMFETKDDPAIAASPPAPAGDPSGSRGAAPRPTALLGSRGAGPPPPATTAEATGPRPPALTTAGSSPDGVAGSRGAGPRPTFSGPPLAGARAAPPHIDQRATSGRGPLQLPGDLGTRADLFASSPAGLDPRAMSSSGPRQLDTAADPRAHGPLTPRGAVPESGEVDTRDDPAVHGVAAWVPGLRLSEDLVLGEKLGEGAMGAVFEAERAGMRVAIKTLPMSAPPVAIERFRREGAAQAAADAHPAIVRVLGSGEAHGRHFLVLEHLPGGDLQRWLDQTGPLPWRDAVAMVGKLARGVAHVHSRGVLHRDLKPANVMFDAAGAPKIADFGVARVAGGEALTMTGAVVGTPAFCAPEQAGGDSSHVDERADVYGLGAILFAALCGRPPFDGPSVPNVITKVLRDPPTAPSSHVRGLPSSVDRVVLAALAKDPAQRPQSAAALADDLERLLRGESVAARPPRRPLPSWLLPLGVASLLVGIAVVVGRGGFSPPGPPVAALAVASLCSADAVAVEVTVGGAETRTTLFLDDVALGLPLPEAGAARVNVPLGAAGEHRLRLVVTGPGGPEAVAAATVTRLQAPALTFDAPHRSIGGGARLTGRLVGTFTKAWLEVGAKQERLDITDALAPAPGGARLDATFQVPRLTRTRVRLVVREERLGERAEHVLDWQDQPPPPDGMALGPDGVYVNAVDGSRLRWIWPGTGHLGNQGMAEDLLAMAEGLPNVWRDVTIGEGFFLGEHEVTRGQVAAFLMATRRARLAPAARGHRAVDADGKRCAPTDEHPMTSLPWAAAKEYCAWAGLRLPTEVEWEWAARGPSAQRFTWGKEPLVEDRTLANTSEQADDWPTTGGVFPVRSFKPATFSGCFDLAGNAWEFVDDPRHELHVVRGGAFDHPRVRTHAAFRYPDRARAGSDDTGFRVARGLSQVGTSRLAPPEPE